MTAANPLRVTLAISPELPAATLARPPKTKGDYTSEIIWGLLGLFAIAWELYCVFTEKSRGNEMLTTLVRDRLFVMGKVGIVFRLLGIFGSLWVVLHFFAPDFIPGPIL